MGHHKRGSYRAMTLFEVVVGIGLAGTLVLMVLLLGTTALSTDAKASDRQIASAVAESQLDILARSVSLKDSPARIQFWGAQNGEYTGPPVAASVMSNGTQYGLSYHVETVRSPTGDLLGGTSNRLRKVDLTVSWWEDGKGRPGYGDLRVERTRVLRESDIRD